MRGTTDSAGIVNDPASRSHTPPTRDYNQNAPGAESQLRFIVAFLAAFSFGLLWRGGRQPLFIYYSVAYGLGLAATFIDKFLK